MTRNDKKKNDINLILQHLHDGETIENVCYWFKTSQSTVYRIMHNWISFGIQSSTILNLNPKKRVSILDDIYIEAFLIGMMELQPSTTLKEYQIMLEEYFNVIASLSIICRFYKNRNISYKRLYNLAFEANAADIVIFKEIIDALVTDGSQLVFIDESHRNAKTANRKYGRAVVNQRAREIVRYGRGSYSLSLILAADISGPICYEVIHGGVNAEILTYWMFNALLPLLNPYPGPKSVSWTKIHPHHR